MAAALREVPPGATGDPGGGGAGGALTVGGGADGGGAGGAIDVPGGHVYRGTPNTDKAAAEPSGGTTGTVVDAYTVPLMPSPARRTPTVRAPVTGTASHKTVTGMSWMPVSRGCQVSVPDPEDTWVPTRAVPLTREYRIWVARAELPVMGATGMETEASGAYAATGWGMPNAGGGLVLVMTNRQLVMPCGSTSAPTTPPATRVTVNDDAARCSVTAGTRRSSACGPES